MSIFFLFFLLSFFFYILFSSSCIMHFSTHVQFFSSLCKMWVNTEVTIRVVYCLTFSTYHVAHWLSLCIKLVFLEIGFFSQWLALFELLFWCLTVSQCPKEVVKIRYVWATMLLWCSTWHNATSSSLLNQWNSKVDWPGRRYSRNITVESWTVRSWRRANNLLSSSAIVWTGVSEKS